MLKKQSSTYLTGSPLALFCLKLKRPFVLSDACQLVHVEVFDVITEGFENLGFPFQEVGAYEIHRRGVVGVQFAVAGEQFEEGVPVRALLRLSMPPR